MSQVERSEAGAGKQELTVADPEGPVFRGVAGAGTSECLEKSRSGCTVANNEHNVSLVVPSSRKGVESGKWPGQVGRAAGNAGGLNISRRTRVSWFSRAQGRVAGRAGRGVGSGASGMDLG